MRLVIGTRKSRLARAQVSEVLGEMLSAGARIEPEIVAIDTAGDKDKATPLSRVTASDFFTREIEAALLSKKIDVAIHSAKDLPSEIPQGLAIIAITGGKSGRDVLVSRDRTGMDRLPQGAKIGTSSPRRMEAIARIRSDLRHIEVRGTIDERLALVSCGELDALVVAEAALVRLGLERLVTEILPIDTPFLQGKLAVEAREDDRALMELFSVIDARKSFGTVYLAGAGPGDPSLVTVKAAKALARADVLFYDSLVDETLVRTCKAREKIDVGKRKGSCAYSQEEIDSMLVRKAGEGKTVVRLKGGDPCVFGRVREEAGELGRNFIPYEIVPGITAAQAASAYAEIPLTERGVSSSFSICTGHPETSIRVPGSDVLVYYMAADSVETVARRVVSAGVPCDTPACLVVRACMPGQTLVRGSLGFFFEKPPECRSPALLFIGKGADTAGSSWFDCRKKVLFTGTDPERYVHLGEITHRPMIECVAVEPNAETTRVLGSIRKYSAVLFTSKHAVHATFDLLLGLGMDSRSLHGLTVAAIGKVTRDALRERGVIADLVPLNESSDGLVEELASGSVHGERFLFPRSNIADPAIVTAIEDLGNEVNPLVVYETRAPRVYGKEDLSVFDAIVFTSPSCVRNFRNIYGEIPETIEVIATGEVTMREVRHGAAAKVS